MGEKGGEGVADKRLAFVIELPGFLAANKKSKIPTRNSHTGFPLFVP